MNIKTTVYDEGYEIILKPSNLAGMRYHRYLRRDKIKEWSNIWNIPENKVIVHHIDGNTLNNNLDNLMIMTANNHSVFHNKGFKHSLEDCVINSKSKKKENLPFRVSKVKDETCTQGFMYYYKYFDNKKRKAIISTDIYRLKEKVLDKGLKWDWFDFNHTQKQLI